MEDKCHWNGCESVCGWPFLSWRVSSFRYTEQVAPVVDRSPDHFSRHFCVPVPIKYPLNPTFQGAMLLTRAKNCAENAASCSDVGLLWVIDLSVKSFCLKQFYFFHVKSVILIFICIDFYRQRHRQIK